MKAPEQMFLDHRKLRSSNRIKVVTGQVGIGDVVKFGHRVFPVHGKVVLLQILNAWWRKVQCQYGIASILGMVFPD